jgi:hypothetical protein
MIRNIVIIATVLLITACSTTKAPERTGESPVVESKQEEVVIIEISQGKMKKIDDKYVIYEHTDNMVYEVNDQCIYNKEPIDCLRHGFKIKYNSYGYNVRLDCLARTNISVNSGNVAQEKHIDTQEDDFYMDLKASENEFVNVQYISGQPGLEDLLVETSCSYKRKEVFRFRQRIRF